MVSEALAAIVPRVFSDAGDASAFRRPVIPYEAARLKLARAIVAAKHAKHHRPSERPTTADPRPTTSVMFDTPEADGS